MFQILEPEVPGMMALIPALKGRGRRISELEASLVQNRFQDIQGYAEKSCLGLGCGVPESGV